MSETVSSIGWGICGGRDGAEYDQRAHSSDFSLDGDGQGLECYY